MTLRQLLRGLSTHVPGIDAVVSKLKGTGGTVSSRYCYSVWLRHLVMLEQSTGRTSFETIAELGPGDSLGIGLAGMLTGSNHYHAFDIIKFASVKQNMKIFDELVELFRNREPIPGEDEFPGVHPSLKNYNFPSQILTKERQDASLEPCRLEEIRNQLRNLGEDTASQTDIGISYVAPWFEAEILRRQSVDLIFSQAVMEHVEDLDQTYKAMKEWLKPDGVVSHQIDFRSHGYTNEWNGHWVCSDFAWKLLMGRKSYILNRAPHSKHLEYLLKHGFRLKCDQAVTSQSKYRKAELAERFRFLTDDDHLTSGSLIQAHL